MVTACGDESWLDDVLTTEGHKKIIKHLMKKMKALGLYDDEVQLITRSVEVEADARYSSVGPMEYLKTLSRSMTEMEREATAKSVVDPLEIPLPSETLAEEPLNYELNIHSAPIYAEQSTLPDPRGNTAHEQSPPVPEASPAPSRIPRSPKKRPLEQTKRVTKKAKTEQGSFWDQVHAECTETLTRFSDVEIQFSGTFQKPILVIGYFVDDLPKLVIQPHESYFTTGTLEVSFTLPQPRWEEMFGRLRDRFSVSFQKMRKGSGSICSIVGLWVRAVSNIVDDLVWKQDPKPSCPPSGEPEVIVLCDHAECGVSCIRESANALEQTQSEVITLCDNENCLLKCACG